MYFLDWIPAFAGMTNAATLIVNVGDGAVDEVAEFHGGMKTRNGQPEKGWPFGE